MKRHLSALLFLALTMDAAAQGAGPDPSRVLDRSQVQTMQRFANPLPNQSQATVTPIASLPPGLARRFEILEELRATIPATLPVSAGQAFLRAQANGKAMEKLKGTDVNGADDYLGALSPFQSDTAEWHIDMGQRWVNVIQEMSQGTDRSNVQPAVARLLQHLDRAVVVARQANNLSAQVGALSLAAYVHERVRGDVPSAIASYKAVLALQPNDQNAREGVSRLEAALANLRARGRQGPR